jgi:hypothetical protein
VAERIEMMMRATLWIADIASKTMPTRRKEKKASKASDCIILD